MKNIKEVCTKKIELWRPLEGALDTNYLQRQSVLFVAFVSREVENFDSHTGLCVGSIEGFLQWMGLGMVIRKGRHG